MANSDSHMKDLLTTALEDSGLLFEDILEANDLNQAQMGFEDLDKTTANSIPSKKPMITRLYSPSIEVEHKNSGSPKTLNFSQPIKLVSSNDATKFINTPLASSQLNLNPKISLLRLPNTSSLLMNKIPDRITLSSKANILNLANTMKSQLDKNINSNIPTKLNTTNMDSDIEIIQDNSYLTENKFQNLHSSINLTATSHDILQNIQSPVSYSNQAMINNATNPPIYNYNGGTPTTLSLADRFERFLQNKHNGPMAAPPSTPNQLFSPHHQLFSSPSHHQLLTNQLFSQVPPSQHPHPLAGDREATEEEMAELEDQLRHVETYAEYMPKKLRYGCRHPDSVVETNSLSSVEPPGIWYSISLPESVIDTCALSALQLEAIIYACQQHEILLPDGCRAGFLIGDGPGVGKGRTIAGIIYENYLLRRKRAIWLSVSNDLKYDAERDLKDIDAGKISVASLNKFKYKKISSKSNGSFKKGIIFATYSSLIGESQRKGKYNTRMRQLLKWCGKNFDGVIIFDECHKAKNLVPSGSSKPTKTGLAVLELQNRLPKARVVYASATGATEPKNMAYMVRLGIWGRGTPFKEFQDFIQAVERRGVGAMELVAMDMKLRGTYMARQLSFAGVSFIVKEAKLNQNITEIYDASVELWAKAREKFQLAFDLMENGESLSRKQVWSQFWAAHQRFFKYLCLAAKVSMCIALAKQALKDGKCVVIGLQTTGEARTLEHIEDCGGEIFDFISTAKGVLQSLIEKHFPSSSCEASGHKSTTPWALENIMRLRGLTAGYSSTAGLERPKDQPKPSRWILDSVAKTGGAEAGGATLKQKIVDVFAPTPAPPTLASPPSPGPGGEDVKGGSPSGTSSDDDDDVTSDEEIGDGEEEDEDEVTDEDRNPFDDDYDDDEEAPWLARKRKKRSRSGRDKKKSKQNDASSLSLSTPSTKFQDGADIKPDNLDNSQPPLSSISNLSNNTNELVKSENEVDNKQNGLENATNYGYNGLSTTCISNTKDSVKLMRHELLAEIEELGDRLPPNTLDQLIEELGGPDQVAEMTGRKGRVVTLPDGSIGYQTRGEIDVPLEALNVKEKQRFMDGIKKIAIISEAASSGISLQSDRRAINQLRRVHITLELPWSADKAVQQFGRTHRSNQVSAPEYIFLISELAGERRFASIVAKRLESLGALTHGDRRATETRDLSQFNFDNKYGRMALDSVMRSILTPSVAFVEPPSDYGKNFFNDAKEGLIAVGMIIKEHHGGYTLDKDYSNIVKFLNRLLGLKVNLQNALFQYFTDTLNAYILDAKRTGKWDMGILDFGTSGDSVIPLRKQTFHFHTSRGVVSTQLWCFQVQRGLPWDAATKLYREQQDLEDGFFVSKQVKNGIYVPILALSHASRKNVGGPSDSMKGDNKLFNIYRPNTGLQGKMETLANLTKKYRKVPPQEAESHWNAIFTSSLNQCSHVLWKGSCKKANAGLFCDIGIRTRKYYVLAGSVLSVWNCLEELFSFLPGGGLSKMQIIRVKTKNDQRIIGVWVRANYVPPLVKILSRESNKTDCEDFIEEIL